MLVRSIKTNPKKSAIVLVLFVGALILVGDNEDAAAPSEETRPGSVALATVASLSRETSDLVVLGEVRSVSQAQLRAQRPGKVTRVLVTAGDTVTAGTILAEIDAAAERAAVLSAQGTLAAAEAQLAKARAGARTEDRVSASAAASGATISLQAAEEAARNTYGQAYTLAADAIVATADDYFSNPYTVNPSFRVRSATFDERQLLEAERVAIGTILENWRTRTTTSIAPNDLDSMLISAQNDLDRIKQFLNTISSFISEQEVPGEVDAATKATQEASMLGAKSSIDGARASVTGARQSLANAASAQVAASFSESKIAIGERPEDIAIAEASVTQARGALAGAAAALENALIRTPISGTVTVLNVAPGDFVTAQESVAVVAREGALEIESFVTARALERIVVGMPITVGGSIEGTVTSRAPGLDPQTKKARITVGVPQDTNLVNGSLVELSFAAAQDTTQSDLSIPITAIKVLPQGLSVFLVDENNTLVAQEIAEGPIVGDKMIVRDGLTPDMQIVTDVRGLAEGDQVTIER